MEEWDNYRRSQSRAYLEGVRDLGLKVEAVQAEAERIRDMVGGLRGLDYSQPKVRVSPVGDDSMVNAVAAVQEVTKAYCTDLAAYLEAYQEARACLDRMGGKGAAVLRLHYLANEKWAGVAEKLGYGSAETAKKAGKAALAAFYDYVPLQYRDPLHPAT